MPRKYIMITIFMSAFVWQMFTHMAFAASIEEQRTQEVLQRFQEGYRRKDMKLIKSCFWKLDASREVIIKAELKQWDAISLEFTNVSFDISGISAIVKCDGEISYTLKKDLSQHQTPRSYTFSFVKAHSRWVIQTMNVVGDEFILLGDVRQKSRAVALILAVVPGLYLNGLGQFYNDDFWKGFTFLGVEGLAVTLIAIAVEADEVLGNRIGYTGAIIWYGSYIWSIIDAYKSAHQGEVIYNPVPKAALQLQNGPLQFGLPTLMIQKSRLPNYPDTNYIFRLVNVIF